MDDVENEGGPSTAHEADESDSDDFLIDEDDDEDEDGDEDEPLERHPSVFTTIHHVRALVLASIDDSGTPWPSGFSGVRPGWDGHPGVGPVPRHPRPHPPHPHRGLCLLGHTLFLTILAALLTNTFSRIVAAEAAETQFLRAVLTFDGVQRDAIFSYPPPFNIAALVILLALIDSTQDGVVLFTAFLLQSYRAGLFKCSYIH